MRSPRTLAATLLLRAGRMPRLDPPNVDRETEARFAEAADAGVAAEPRLAFFQWLATERRLLFHGSSRPDLDRLEPIRLTRDDTAFGDQQAVFAASDPVWAIYFGVLSRGNGFRSTRNGSLAPAGGTLYPRWYFFSHNEGADPATRFGDGWLYALPSEGFRPQPPLLGLVDTGQWVSPEPVVPLFRLAIGPDDFPFRHLVGRHRDEDPPLKTVLGFGRGAAR